MTHLDFFLGELLTAAHLADLVRHVVPTRSASGAIIFSHATDTLFAKLPLLLALFLAVVATVRIGFTSNRKVVDGVLATTETGERHARNLSIRAWSWSPIRKICASFSLSFGHLVMEQSQPEDILVRSRVNKNRSSPIR